MNPFDSLTAIRRAGRIQEPEQQQEDKDQQWEKALDAARQKDEVRKQSSNPALSALAGVGNLLDVPGSMVRDTLALKNPFDQILSPFSDKNRTTGRDLNRQFGLSGEKDTWGNFAGGLATEIGTDPLSWATLGLWGAGKGVATRAGRAAEKVGLQRYAKEAAEAAGKVPSQNILSQRQPSR